MRFVSKLEVILKNRSCQEFKNFEKLELISLISIQNTNFIRDKEEQTKLKISYLQGIEIVSDIVKIHLNGQSNPPIDERAVKAFIDSIFTTENGFVEWNPFITKLKHQFKGASKVIKQYFAHKFMHLSLKIAQPVFDTPSYILTDDWLFILYLSAPSTQLNSCIKLKLLYSTLVHPGGFDQMINQTLDSHLPTLMLFQHEEQYTALHDRSIFSKSHIFGAISNQRWFNTGQACGVPSDCIFSLYPNFHMFYGRKDKGCQRNYCYLNYCQKNEGKQDHPQGIGFGGSQDGHNCRIWIDRNFENSYVREEDSSYEGGSLVEKHVKKLKLTLIEVWGIVHPQQEEEGDDINNKINNIQRNEFLEDNEKQRQSDMLKAGGTESFYWREEKEADFYWMQSSDEEDELYQTQEQKDYVQPLTQQQVSKLPKNKEQQEEQYEIKVETQSQKSNYTDYKSEVLSHMSQKKNGNQVEKKQTKRGRDNNLKQIGGDYQQGRTQTNNLSQGNNERTQEIKANNQQNVRYSQKRRLLNENQDLISRYSTHSQPDNQITKQNYQQITQQDNYQRKTELYKSENVNTRYLNTPNFNQNEQVSRTSNSKKTVDEVIKSFEERQKKRKN